MKFNAAELMGNRTTDMMTVEEYVDSLSQGEKYYHNFTTPSLQTSPWNMIVAQGKLQPDFLNSTCIGRELRCVGYTTDYVEVPDGFKLRCMLVDEEMQVYSTISAGIAKVVKTWISSGIEPSVEQPIKVCYEQVRNGRNTYYTLRILWDKE